MAVKAKEKNFISCVVYLHNDEKTVKPFLDQIITVMEDRFETYEIICVDDACTDHTVDRVKELVTESEASPVISLIHMSFFQGVEIAMNAGRELAVGDMLYEFDKCLLDFEESLITKLYERMLEGYDVVSAAPRRGVKLSSRLFYGVYNLGVRGQAKLRQERFRILSRRAINRVGQLNAYIPYRKAMYMNCGLKADVIEYDNRLLGGSGHDKSERDVRQTLAFDAIILFTNVLEKVSVLISGVLFAALLAMLVYLIWSIFSATRPVEGWLSIMFLLTFGFLMISLMLTLIFKYLELILNMSFKRERYVVEGIEKLTQ